MSSMMEDIPDDLIYASFFFVDIVGLSNPILSTETQRNKIKILNENIYNCKTFLSTPKEHIYILPTGDGMLIGFKDGLEEPIKLAIELHAKIRKYNSNVSDTEKIGIRIGCNNGYIFVVKDVFENTNLWGPGAILARRVMDLGDENHILLTSSLVNDLIEISEYYEKILHPIHSYTIKHNEEIFLFSAYDENFGNSNPPKKTTSAKKNINDDEGILCAKIIFNLKMPNDGNNTLNHERVYYMSNKNSMPLYELNIGIITHGESEFSDLDFKAFDEYGEQKISKVFAHTPFSKEILIKLDPPVFFGDKDRLLKIQYHEQSTRNSFENFFYTNAHNLEFNFITTSNNNVKPELYYIDSKLGGKIRISNIKKTIKGVSTVFTWEENKTVHKNDMIRVEW